MELTINDNIPKLQIDNYEIIGWDMKNMPPKYINHNAIVFSNDQEFEDLETKLYELIEDFTVNDFPDSRIELIICKVRINITSRPLDRLPYPFYGVTIGIKNNKFLLRFSTIQEKGIIDDDWNKKWTNEFYFDALSKVTERSSDFFIKYEKNDDFISASIELLSVENNVGSAVDMGIVQIKCLLEKVERSINGLDGFFNVIEIWNKNKNEKNERFWQDTFKRYSWIISMAINEPAMIFEDEAFIGGKNLSNQNGKIVDFLYKNKLTDNVALIEIKTPATKIIGSKYRNTFSITQECSGAINQLLHYRESMQKEFFSLAHRTNDTFNLSSSNCYLIIGSQENMQNSERDCFENYRRNLSGIEILTFDELFEKLFFVLSLIEQKS